MNVYHTILTSKLTLHANKTMYIRLRSMYCGQESVNWYIHPPIRPLGVILKKFQKFPFHLNLILAPPAILISGQTLKAK